MDGVLGLLYFRRLLMLLSVVFIPENLEEYEGVPADILRGTPTLVIRDEFYSCLSDDFFL